MDNAQAAPGGKALCGFINVYKEAGYTSHDVVAIVRKALNRAKTGHTGTLDPAAEGVLPVCIGKATKLSDMLSAQRKGYRAEVILGATTDTLDFTGTVLETRPVNVTCEEITTVVASFKGEQEQLPPMYSAVKVEGRRLYQLARAGVVAERKPRAVTIYDINIDSFTSNERFIIDVQCSKGTYIRTLCEGIGEALGCGAHMGQLLRTSSGNFHLSESVKLGDIKAAAEDGRIHELIITVDKALPNCSAVYVSESAAKRLVNGNTIDVRDTTYEAGLMAPGDRALLYGADGGIAGIYDLCGAKDGLYFKPVAMLM